MAEVVIQFLKSRSHFQLVSLGINDQTTTIMKSSKVNAKRNLIQTNQDMCNTISRNGKIFKEKIGHLHKRELPPALLHRLVTIGCILMK